MVADVKTNRAFLNANFLHNWLNRVGPALGLLLVIGIFTLLMDTPARFLSPNNLRIVLSQTVIVAIGAIGMTLIIISGGIDLAVGSTIALTGVVTALGINAGMPPSLALATGILMGGVGVVNGLVITRLKVVPFIATWHARHRTRRREVVGQSTDRQHAGDMVERAAGHVSESGVAAGRPRSVDHNRPRCARGDRFASNGIWTPRLCARIERGRGARAASLPIV